jgi:hypothetical protein
MTCDDTCRVSCFVPDEEHSVRKAVNQRASDCEVGLSVLVRKTLRRVPHYPDRFFHRVEESIPKAQRPTFVPSVCLLDVGLSFGPDNEVRCHRPLWRKFWMRARTSVQGDPAFGSRRYASARRRSSARCDSVIGGSAESAGRLSQRATASSTRCGCQIREIEKWVSHEWNLCRQKVQINVPR